MGDLEGLSTGRAGSAPHSGRPVGERVSVDGHTFWRAASGGRETELTTQTGLELDAHRCRWTVIAPGAAAGTPVESRSREVRRFMLGILAEMHRATLRAMHSATVRPVPKPVPKPATPLPANAPVPCPLCHGEGWPDCELCDGAGVVTQRQASDFIDAHGR